MMLNKIIFAKIVLLLFITSCVNEKTLENGTKITELVKNPQYICYQSPYETEEIFSEHVYKETGQKLKNFTYQDNGTVIWIYDSENSSFKKFKLRNLYLNIKMEGRCHTISKNNLENFILNINKDNHTFSIGDK